ncbi:MAG TPA: aminotransferase class I/II-fold pyridoxal phosphate-dependent enzyme [Gemmatimonadaceae bacterium]|nr:aminotransferase class I/II-fold pyridoxal phosphate-dependent enzyme [Gemmatimonadaceae bacterium]
MPRITSRVSKLPLYAVGALAARKRELVARGVDLIDLGAGDADLAPPPAAVEALVHGAHVPALQRYGFGVGYYPYREAIAAFMQRRFGLTFDPATEVVPLIGSKEGIAHCALAFLEHGDVAVVPEPGYICYAGGTLLADADVHAYALRADQDFLLELSDVPPDVLARTRLLYLNYPNNPTGAIAPRDYLERVVAECRARDILLVYDNAYSELAFDGYVPPSIFEIPGADEVAIEFHSLSKTYNMTGWRCAWAVARPPIAGALARVKQFIDTGHYMAIQAAGVAALESWETFVPGNVATFQERRDAAVAAFRAEGFAVESPQATMYLWIPLPAGMPSALFAERLLEEHGVVVLPGSSFGDGGEGFVRISFIVPPERLAQAARHAGQVLRSLESRV